MSFCSICVLRNGVPVLSISQNEHAFVGGIPGSGAPSSGSPGVSRLSWWGGGEFLSFLWVLSLPFLALAATLVTVFGQATRVLCRLLTLRLCMCEGVFLHLPPSPRWAGGLLLGRASSDLAGAQQVPAVFVVWSPEMPVRSPTRSLCAQVFAVYNPLRILSPLFSRMELQRLFPRQSGKASPLKGRSPVLPPPRQGSERRCLQETSLWESGDCDGPRALSPWA